MRTCNTCEFLNLTEGEQNLIKRQHSETPPHICKKYNKRVTHFPLPHPMIHPCKECIADRKESEDMK
jgi:hypothetical protein